VTLLGSIYCAEDVCDEVSLKVDFKWRNSSTTNLEISRLGGTVYPREGVSPVGCNKLPGGFLSHNFCSKLETSSFLFLRFFFCFLRFSLTYMSFHKLGMQPVVPTFCHNLCFLGIWFQNFVNSSYFLNYAPNFCFQYLGLIL
jgi:hypothetical protein